MCTNQLTELRPLLLDKVKVDTQLVMLFTPVKVESCYYYFNDDDDL